MATNKQLTLEDIMLILIEQMNEQQDYLDWTMDTDLVNQDVHSPQWAEYRYRTAKRWLDE